MANFPTATRASQAANLSVLVEADAGAATWRFYTAGFAALLVSIPLNEPAFTELSGVLTLSEVPSPSALITGNGLAAVWEICDGNGTRVVDGDVGLGAEDLDVDDPNFVIGQPVTLTGITLEVPAVGP